MFILFIMAAVDLALIRAHSCAFVVKNSLWRYALEVQYIEVTKIVEDAEQPRKHHDDEGLQGLADSIRQHGMLQPITVTPLANVNMFKIITGERRWRAAQKIHLHDIPCIVRTIEPEEVLTQQLIENLQREDLQPLEKAQALTYVKTQIGATNRELGARLGISERTVGYLLDLVELPDAIGQQIISSPNRPSDGQLTEKHARFLKQLNDQPDLQTAVVEKIQSEKLNSDKAGKLVKALKQRPEKAEEILSTRSDHLVQFFRDLEPDTAVAEVPDGPKRVSTRAQQIVELLPILDAVRPAEMERADVQQVTDALTSLKLAVDGLLRECRLELGETVA
jgi:ParB family chromosome partitioning protein